MGVSPVLWGASLRSLASFSLTALAHTRIFDRTFRIAGVYLLDAQFLDDPTKFFSGMLSAMSTMVTLEVPHVNVLSKMVSVQQAGVRAASAVSAVIL